MKIKIADLLEAQGPLNAVGNTKLPNPAAFRMGKNLNLINTQMKGLEDKRVNTLNAMVKAGTAKLSADKTRYDFSPPESEKDFNDAMNAYKQTEVDLTFSRFTLDDMGSAPIEPLILAALDKLGIISELTVMEGGKVPLKA
jgi:hypothetical protein